MSDMIDWAATLQAGTPAERWAELFQDVAVVALNSTDRDEIEQTLAVGDRILGEAAWDLWEAYPEAAPFADQRLRAWWSGLPTGTGRAVLILDALSVRELRIIVEAASIRGIEVHSAVWGSRVPSDTEAYARALGLSQRSQLKQSGYPKNFILAGESPYTDVADGYDFGSLATVIPPQPAVVLWHPWLDDLVHANAGKASAARHIADVAQKTLSSDAFWHLVDTLRQGRELVVTSDHGYAISSRFVELPGTLADDLRSSFGARRCGPPLTGMPRLVGGQPLTVAADGRAAVLGRWKWKVQGGYPHVTHGGLTLAEVCVPFVTVAAR